MMRYSALWLLVTVVAMGVFGIACYLAAAEHLDGVSRQHVALVLGIETAFLILAVGALAVFTTHRLAGPYIALKRAFDEVSQGELDRPLRLRGGDVHLRELEDSFNEMTSVLRERLQGPGEPGAPA
jgi:nitrogen fixation/metabolism regulation signal transduction histidine kinase